MGTCTTIDQRWKIITKKHVFFLQLCQFFVVMYKIWHYRTMKLHQRAHKTTKKKKHGNLYNDLANVQKSCFWELFFYVDRSLYKFPCFVFLVILEKRPCNVIIHSCLILCKTIKNWQKRKILAAPKNSCRGSFGDSSSEYFWLDG